MDIVYIVGPGDVNTQLRYSLRSLSNFPHHRVWIIGHKPPWTTNIEHVWVPQDKHKHLNTWASWRAMAKHGPISFALFNDDFYVTERVPKPPVEHRGPLDENITRLNTPHLAAWRARAANTRDALTKLGRAGLYWYELHTPLPMRRALLRGALADLERVRDRDLGGYCKRTWYGNHAGLGGTERLDCKVHGHGYVKLDDAGPYLSTSDKSWRGQTGRAIEAMFPDPSPYERQP